MADNYILKVTAGPSYAEQVPISPNSEKPFSISSAAVDASVTVRVQNYRGLPAGSPATSPYFSHPTHKADLYSLQFSIKPKQDLDAHDLVLGNDFDHPIRDRLPPGFDQALKIVKWFIDPGLEGDVYADEPGLFGPLLSSVNVFRVNGADAPLPAESESAAEDVYAEGAVGDEGAALREEKHIPADAAARKKFFLTEAHLKDFTFEKGRRYDFDFYNPYLDFNDFALRLPGFSVIPGITIPVISYWDGQPLRYVLKNRVTNEPLFVVIFTLLPKEKQEDQEEEDKHEAGQDDGELD